MNSILNSIKKMLGLEANYTAFDTDIIIHVNSVFLSLNQLGVGPPEVFSISSAEEPWTSFFGDSQELEAVKSYIYLKVRLIFDPPTSSAVIESINRSISELEWRLNIQVDTQG